MLDLSFDLYGFLLFFTVFSEVLVRNFELPSRLRNRCKDGEQWAQRVSESEGVPPGEKSVSLFPVREFPLIVM